MAHKSTCCCCCTGANLFCAVFLLAAAQGGLSPWGWAVLGQGAGAAQGTGRHRVPLALYSRIRESWVGLDWVGMGWIGFDWVGIGWIGLDWVGTGWVGLD